MRMTPEYRAVTLAAGAYETIFISCKYVTVLQVAGATTINIGVNNEPPQTQYPQTLDYSDNPVSKVRLYNPAAGAVTVLLQFSDVRPSNFQGAAAGGMAALIALITAGNVDLAALEVLVAAGNVDLAALEVLVAAGNVDLAALEVLVGAGNVDLAALEVLVTAGNALLTTIDADTSKLIPATAMTIVNQSIIAKQGVGTTQILAANAARKWCCVTMDINNVGRVWLGSTNGVAMATNSFDGFIAGASWREHYAGAVWGTSENGSETVRAYETT